MTREERLRYQREFMAKRAAERKAAGLCVRCGGGAAEGKTECAGCLEKYGGRTSARRRQRALSGKCRACGDEPLPGRTVCARHDAQERARQDRKNERRKEVRRVRGLVHNEPPHAGPDVEGRKRKLEALAACGGNAQKAADMLGCSRAVINRAAREAGVRIDYQRRYEVFGQRFTIAELSELGGVPKDVIKTRIKRGMAVEDAAMRPVAKGAPF